jgi:hypothetical protein
MSETEDRATLLALASPGLPHAPTRTFKLTEVRTKINKLRPTKSPGYDLISQQAGMFIFVTKEVFKRCVVFFFVLVGFYITFFFCTVT